MKQKFENDFEVIICIVHTLDICVALLNELILTNSPTCDACVKQGAAGQSLANWYPFRKTHNHSEQTHTSRRATPLIIKFRIKLLVAKVFFSFLFFNSIWPLLRPLLSEIADKSPPARDMSLSWWLILSENQIGDQAQLSYKSERIIN